MMIPSLRIWFLRRSVLRLQPCAVLIVDDEPMLREVAADFYSPLAITRSRPVMESRHCAYSMTISVIDAVLLDMVMPVMDSYETLQGLRTS